MALLSHDEIQRRALRAAAKVALAMSTASVFGACGGAVQTTEPDPKGDPLPASGTPAQSGGGTVVVDHSVPDAVVDATSCDVTPDAATPDQLACCSAEVRNAFPPDVVEPIDAGTPSPDLVACCAEIVKDYGGTNDLGLTFQQARACCYVLPGVWYEHGGEACTPWGPPMPRPMPMPWADDGEERVS